MLIALWEFIVWAFAIPNFLLPAPSAIAQALFAEGDKVIPHTLATLQVVLSGFLLSVVISLPIAVAIASSRWVANAIYPLLVTSQSIPVVAIAPILVVAMGTGQMTRLTVTFLIAFFPIVINTTAGLLATPTELLELGRVLRLSRRKQLYLIRFPYAVPAIFSGLKIAVALSVIGAVVAEFAAANEGLGYLITQSTAFFKVPLSFGAVVILALIGITLFQFLNLIERRLFSWSAIIQTR